jgi:hypothetical protein
MTLYSVVNASAGVALLALVAFVLFEQLVQSRLELYYGSSPLPRGAERWNPAGYRPEAARWVRLDRCLSPYATRVWVVLSILNLLLAAWSAILAD